MVDLIQALWDQMRADLSANVLPQLNQASQALLSHSLGPLTEAQVEDLESVHRSLSKLNQHLEGKPIDWTDYDETAHALRGPLNSTIGFSRLILKGIDGPVNRAQRAALERIHSISRRLLVLFNLMLDALLLARDGISFNKQRVEADVILKELVAAGQILANRRGFLFEADVAPQVADVTIECDAMRLKQALSGLLAVSSKYMNKGAVTLQAGISDDELVIRMKNRRCQLPASLLADLACLLTDGADRSLPYDAHLRLGLAWHLLAAMDGNLEAEHAGTTCTFIIALPQR